MKRSYFSFFCLLILGILSSCSHYYTPIPNDPLFKDPEYKEKSFSQSSTQYTQREEYFTDKTLYQPRESESYDHYRGRMINTLTVQSHTKKQLEKALSDKRHTLAYLKKQLNHIRSQHVDLRIQLSMLKGEMNQDEGQDALFAKYTLIKGDTLQKIAYQTYGVYNAWLGIYRFNSDRLYYGPDRIEEGTEILIPRAKNLFFRR